MVLYMEPCIRHGTAKLEQGNETWNMVPCMGQGTLYGTLYETWLVEPCLKHGTLCVTLYETWTLVEPCMSQVYGTLHGTWCPMWI